MSKLNATRFIVLLLVLAMCCIATQSFAQSQASSGQISGAVKDAAGAIIVGATVKASNVGTGFTQSVTTGENGLYRLVLLPPGNYKVTFSQQGFAESAAQVDVGVGRTTELNVALTVGGRKEEVTVTAEMIEATRHENSAFVDSTVVANVPLNGRRFHDIATLTPSVQIDPQRGGISMSGQRMVNTGSINVDGADYGQLFFGGIRGGERSNFAPTLPLESIQEFQIIRSGYSAEFGRSTGGAITAITKSGTNSFHGSGNYAIRHEKLGRSNEYYDTVRANLQPTCPTCVVNPNPTLQQWGGSIGGPVKKDKFFFFGSYDQQRQRIPHQVFFDKLVGFTPTANTQEAFNIFKSLETPYQQTNDAWLFLAKADYQISNRHRLSVRYNHSNYEGLNAVSVGAGIGVTVLSALSNNGTELDKTRTLVGSLTSFFGHFANEFRGQYARETRPRPANALAPTVGSTGGVGAYGTVNFLGQNEEYDYRIQFADNITWMSGGHTFKFGGEFNHIYAAQTFGFNQFGSFQFSASDATTILSLMSLNGTATDHRFDATGSSGATYLRQIGNLQAAMSGKQIAAFAQDSWRIRPNLTLNYGLRWEGSWNPQPDANNAMVAQVNGFQFPVGGGMVEDPRFIPNQPHQFASRAGFAWDPFSNGKTVIRGFGGVYFASTPLLLYAGPVNNFREPPGDLSVLLPITGFTSFPASCPAPCNTLYKQLLIAGINLDNYTLDKLPIVTPDQMATITSALGLNKYGGAGPIFVENDYKNPRSYQAGFGVERQVTPGWTLALEGSWIKTVHLERNRDLNIPVATCTDAAGRPVYRLTGSAPAGSQGNCAARTRPLSALGSVQVRDSSAKSLYRGMTVRTNFQRKWAAFTAYYTLSENISDDDNERTSGGVAYADSYNFAPEYSFSNLDRKHMFVASPVFFLPKRFEVSTAIRLLSGAPQSATLGSDINQDRASTDRPYQAVGVPFQRNSFRDRALTFIDLRIQKTIPIKESKLIKISAEFFNLFNLMNLTYSGTTVTNFCQALNSTNPIPTTCGIGSFQGAGTGGTWIPNAKFLQLRDPVTGALLTSNNAGLPFQTQLSVRFQF